MTTGTTVAPAKIRNRNNQDDNKGEQRHPTVECNIREMIPGKYGKKNGKIMAVTEKEKYTKTSPATIIMLPPRSVIIPPGLVSPCCFLSWFVHATLLLSRHPFCGLPPLSEHLKTPEPKSGALGVGGRRTAVTPSRTRSSSLSDAPCFPSLLGAVETAAINRDLLQKSGRGGRRRR